MTGVGFLVLLPQGMSSYWLRKYHADAQCQLAFIPDQLLGRTSKILIDAGANVNRSWAFADDPKAIVSVLAFQVAIQWKTKYTYLEDPEGDAIKKLRMMFDHGLSIKGHNFVEIIDLALKCDNERIAGYLTDVVKERIAEANKIRGGIMKKEIGATPEQRGGQREGFFLSRNVTFNTSFYCFWLIL